MSITSGVTSVLQGGKFGHGFASAGLGAIAGGAIKFGKSVALAAKAGVRAVIDGTISKLSGGKFSNGAISAAFSEIVNNIGETYKPSTQDPTFVKDGGSERFTKEQQAAIKKEISLAVSDKPNEGFIGEKGEENAAKYLQGRIQSSDSLLA